MALKSIFTIDVKDGAFKRFADRFNAFRDELSKTPGQIDALSQQLDKLGKNSKFYKEGLEGSVEKLTDTIEALAHRFDSLNLSASNAAKNVRGISPAVNQASSATVNATNKWAALGRGTAHVASTIKDATLSLGK